MTTQHRFISLKLMGLVLALVNMVMILTVNDGK